MNSEIFEGLKLAVSKGESLKMAMISFHNAGYKKEEIEEAARVLQQQKPISKTPETKPAPKKQFVKKPISQKKLSQKISAYGTPQKPKQISLKKITPKTFEKKEITKKPIPQKKLSQKISDYDKKPKPKIVIIILLVFFLLILLGIAAAVFLFKQELLDFFNKIS